MVMVDIGNGVGLGTKMGIEERKTSSRRRMNSFEYEINDIDIS